MPPEAIARAISYAIEQPDDLNIAEELAIRNSFEGGPRYNVLGTFAKLAAEVRFSVPIARTFALENGERRLTSAWAGAPAKE